LQEACLPMALVAVAQTQFSLHLKRAYFFFYWYKTNVLNFLCLNNFITILEIARNHVDIVNKCDHNFCGISKKIDTPVTYPLKLSIKQSGVNYEQAVWFS